MGTYLATGIVQDISIDKRHIKQDITIDQIVERLKKELNIDCYNYSEDVEGYYWQIKPEMLEDNLAEFLDVQFQMSTSKKDSDMQEAIDKVREIKTGKQIIELSKSKSLINFQFVHQIIEHISVVRTNNGSSESIRVYFDLMAYFLEGKIIMESYGSSFTYFENNIRLQRDKYPIVDCVKVMITS